MPKLQVDGCETKWYRCNGSESVFETNQSELVSIDDVYYTTVEDIGHTIRAVYFKNDKQRTKDFKIKIPIKLRLKLNKYLKKDVIFLDDLYIKDKKHTVHFDRRTNLVALFNRTKCDSYTISDLRLYPMGKNSVLFHTPDLEFVIETKNRHKRDLFVLLFRKINHLWLDKK